MILEAVKGTPATARSGTKQFRIKRRARTPRRHSKSDSSAGGLESDLNSRLVAWITSSHEATGHHVGFWKSKGAREMALNDESFQIASASDRPSLKPRLYLGCGKH